MRRGTMRPVSFNREFRRAGLPARWLCYHGGESVMPKPGRRVQDARGRTYEMQEAGNLVRVLPR